MGVFFYAYTAEVAEGAEDCGHDGYERVRIGIGRRAFGIGADDLDWFGWYE